MTKSFRYEKIQVARRMEAVLLAGFAVGGILAVFAFMSYGWIAGVGAMLLTLIAFSLSQLFSLGCELLTAADPKAIADSFERRGDNQKAP